MLQTCNCKRVTYVHYSLRYLHITSNNIHNLCLLSSNLTLLATINGSASKISRSYSMWFHELRMILNTVQIKFRPKTNNVTFLIDEVTYFPLINLSSSILILLLNSERVVLLGRVDVSIFI